MARKKQPARKIMSILNFQPHIRVLVNSLSVFERDGYLYLLAETLLWYLQGLNLKLILYFSSRLFIATTAGD